jgi:hypothetical protein
MHTQTRTPNTRQVALHALDHERLTALVQRFNEVQGRRVHTLQSFIKYLLDLHEGRSA